MTNKSEHPASIAPDRLWADCRMRRQRRSGPGGQHRNKVETAVILRHEPTGVTAEASERRSQAENRRVAVFRLRVNLAIEVRCPVAPEDRPSPLWRSRCGGGKIAVAASHEDFPAVLAEALDVIAACEADVKAAAQVLTCTPSQLVKLLKKEPRAVTLVNRWRHDRQLHPLQ